MSTPNIPKKSSETLDINLKKHIPESIEKQINYLECFRISNQAKEYIESTRNAICSNEWILWKSELAEIVWCLSETKVDSLWLLQEFNTRLHRVWLLSANNPNWDPDENFIDRAS